MNTQLNECPRCNRQYYDERVTNDLCSDCERYLEWEAREREMIIEDHNYREASDEELNEYDPDIHDIADEWE